MANFKLQDKLKEFKGDEEWLRFFTQEELDQDIKDESEKGKFITSLLAKNDELKLKPNAFVAIIKDDDLHKHHDKDPGKLKDEIEKAASGEHVLKFTSPTLPAKDEDALKKRFEKSKIQGLENYKIEKKDKTFEVTAGKEGSAPKFVISHEGVKCQKKDFSQEDAEKMIAVYKANISEPHYVGSISAKSTEQYKLMLDAAIKSGANLSQLAAPKGATEYSQKEMQEYLEHAKIQSPNSFSRPTSTILFEALQQPGFGKDNVLVEPNI